ncbi:uncharacterized protein YcnI [Allocatelliglobosispora scoriae]|uniref:Uncharacterized protein YcnI n=1 Tax=Allocatelliglobosispora scoriae TaxID=643052 RepID=A0A841BUF6_9ACTN|nr:YcnI family protein [Allocatelliglobosispora scoriae]MBB5871834.1 uncharacterized protein YcnI [Allocatelliglobosispora scoriae]
MRATTVGRLAAAVLGGVVAAAWLGASAASAHVTVNPKEAVQGGYAKLAFRVPNEKPTAGTVKLEVNIPIEAPIASISTRPVPGWTVALERTKLATPVKVHGNDVSEVVSKVTWTAAAGVQIKPGEFQEFEISAGPLPQVDLLLFKALQTYSDGEIVRWIEDPATPDVAHPAPALKLTKAATTTPVNATASPSVVVAAEPAEAPSNTLPIVLGAAGLIAGLAGLGVALSRRPRPTA